MCSALLIIIYILIHILQTRNCKMHCWCQNNQNDSTYVLISFFEFQIILCLKKIHLHNMIKIGISLFVFFLQILITLLILHGSINI